MDPTGIKLPSHHQAVLDRFVAACQADERVVAAFLAGSYARDGADSYSDLDLGLITTDDAFEGFIASRETFVRQLDEPLFLEVFDNPSNVFFISHDDTEAELAIGRESDFCAMHSGPYQIPLDKTGILSGADFPRHAVDRVEQGETLRRLVFWFWHGLSHFITAMGRGQLWWAQGQLEALRLQCVNLVRLGHDFSAAAEGYEKVEQALPVEQLSPLEATFCPLEQGALLQAGLAIVHSYRELAPRLARRNGVPYPDGLERVMMARLEKLQRHVS